MSNKMILFVTLCTTLVGCFSLTTAEPLIADDSVAVVDYPSQALSNSPNIRMYFEVYPTTLHWGDTIYIVNYAENISDNEVQVREDRLNPYDNVGYDLFSFYADGVDGDYFWVAEHPWPLHADRFPPPHTLKPGEKFITCCRALEFPPIEDWKNPFCTALKDKIQEQGQVSCFLRFNLNEGEGFLSRNKTDASLIVDVPVQAKKRSGWEEQRLMLWLTSTPEVNLPSVRCYTKYVKNFTELKNALPSYDIAGTKVSYNDLVRSAYRKPSPPDLPCFIDCEEYYVSHFCDSTLKDELTLMCLKIKYYQAQGEENSERALRELIDWINQRPFPQRYVMSKMVYSDGIYRWSDFPKESELRPKMARMYKELRLLIQTCEAHVND